MQDRRKAGRVSTRTHGNAGLQTQLASKELDLAGITSHFLQSWARKSATKTNVNNPRVCGFIHKRVAQKEQSFRCVCMRRLRRRKSWLRRQSLHSGSVSFGIDGNSDLGLLPPESTRSTFPPSFNANGSWKDLANATVPIECQSDTMQQDSDPPCATHSPILCPSTNRCRLRFMSWTR